MRIANEEGNLISLSGSDCTPARVGLHMSEACASNSLLKNNRRAIIITVVVSVVEQQRLVEET